MDLEESACLIMGRRNIHTCIDWWPTHFCRTLEEKKLSLKGENSDARLENIIVGDSEKPSGWIRDYYGQFAKIKPIDKESIINNNLNQYQIAKEYGLSQGWISKIINGK